MLLSSYLQDYSSLTMADHSLCIMRSQKQVRMKMVKTKTTVIIVSAENRKIRPAKTGSVMGVILFTSDGIMLDIVSM